MSDLLIRSKLSKEETIRKLGQVFSKGNAYNIKLQVLHGEYYLSSDVRPGFGRFGTIDSLFIQFRMKEDASQTTIYLTPQSKALSIVIAIMVIFFIWIILIAQSIGEQRWLGWGIYGIGVGITLLVLCKLRLDRRKEIQIIARIKRELEGMNCEDVVPSSL